MRGIKYSNYFKRERSGHLSAAMKMYRSFVHSLMDQEYEGSLVELSHSVILDSREFVDKIKDRFLRGKQPDRELPALRDMTKRSGLDHVEQVVNSVVPSDEKLARQVKGDVSVAAFAQN